MIIQQIIPTIRGTGGGFTLNFTSIFAALTQSIHKNNRDSVEEKPVAPAIQARFSELYEKHVKRIYTFH